MLNLDIKNLAKNLDLPRCRFGLMTIQCELDAAFIWVDLEGNPIGRDGGHVLCEVHGRYYPSGMMPLADRC